MKTRSGLSIALTHLAKGAPRFTVARRRRMPSTASSDDQRRADVIAALHEAYAVSARGEAASLPTDRWLNEQLAQRGEAWRVHAIDGFRYEIYEPTA